MNLKKIKDSTSDQIEFAKEVADYLIHSLNSWEDSGVIQSLAESLGMQIHDEGHNDTLSCWNIKNMGYLSYDTVEEYATKKGYDADTLFAELNEFVIQDNSDFLTSISEECYDKFGVELVQFGRSGGWFGFSTTDFNKVAEVKDIEAFASFLFSKEDAVYNVDLNDYDAYAIESAGEALRSNYNDELSKYISVEKPFADYLDETWNYIKSESDSMKTKEWTLEFLETFLDLNNYNPI